MSLANGNTSTINISRSNISSNINRSSSRSIKKSMCVIEYREHIILSMEITTTTKKERQMIPIKAEFLLNAYTLWRFMYSLLRSLTGSTFRWTIIFLANLAEQSNVVFFSGYIIFFLCLSVYLSCSLPCSLPKKLTLIDFIYTVNHISKYTATKTAANTKCVQSSPLCCAFIAKTESYVLCFVVCRYLSPSRLRYSHFIYFFFWFSFCFVIAHKCM